MGQVWNAPQSPTKRGPHTKIDVFNRVYYWWFGYTSTFMKFSKKNFIDENLKQTGRFLIIFNKRSRTNIVGQREPETNCSLNLLTFWKGRDGRDVEKRFLVYKGRDFATLNYNSAGMISNFMKIRKQHAPISRKKKSWGHTLWSA